MGKGNPYRKTKSGKFTTKMSDFASKRDRDKSGKFTKIKKEWV